MTKILHGHHRGLEEGMTEEMYLQMFPKRVSDGADVTFSRGVFHSREAVTGKARLLMVERQVHRTTGDEDEAEWRC